MKKTILPLLLCLSIQSYAQKPIDLISVEETERIEKVLSSDEMQGRRTFTPGIEKAAAFIAAEFQQAGLQKWKNSSSHLQSFSMIRPRITAIKGMIGSNPLDMRMVNVVSTQQTLEISQNAGYEVVMIKKDDNYINEARKIMGTSKNTLVIVDTA
ncbi:MAG: hypothetical protein RLY85_197, partial [Bacteroidota bacterium]